MRHDSILWAIGVGLLTLTSHGVTRSLQDGSPPSTGSHVSWPDRAELFGNRFLAALGHCPTTDRENLSAWMRGELEADPEPPSPDTFLGLNLTEARDYATGRWSGDWARFARAWTTATGGSAATDFRGYPLGAAQSVLINGSWPRPWGPWKLSWSPETTHVALSGPGVNHMADSGSGWSTWFLDSPGSVKASCDGPLDELHLWPPNSWGAEMWDPFYAPIENLGLSTFRNGTISAVNFCVPDPPPGSNQLWYPDWAERPMVWDYSWATKQGVPLEMQARIANRMGVATFWYCIPHLADEGYVRAAGSVLLAELDPSIGVILEFSNELWNPGFPQHAYYEAQGDVAVKAGEDAARAFGWFRTIFPSERVTNVVMGWQADGGAFAQAMAASVIANGQTVGGIGCAMYVRPDPSDVAAWIERLRQNGNDLPSENEVLSSIRSVLLNQLPGMIQAHRDLADDLGVSLLVYEGGLSLINQGPFGEPYLAADTSDGAGEILTDLIELAKQKNVDVFAHYGYVANPTTNFMNGSWNLMYNIETPLPKWDAFEYEATH